MDQPRAMTLVISLALCRDTVLFQVLLHAAGFIIASIFTGEERGLRWLPKMRCF